jgi:hypothetical protein
MDADSQGTVFRGLSVGGNGNDVLNIYRVCPGDDARTSPCTFQEYADLCNVKGRLINKIK